MVVGQGKTKSNTINVNGITLCKVLCVRVLRSIMSRAVVLTAADGGLVDQEVEGGGEGGTSEGAADGDPAVPPATSLLAFDGKEGVGEAG